MVAFRPVALLAVFVACSAMAGLGQDLDYWKRTGSVLTNAQRFWVSGYYSEQGKAKDPVESAKWAEKMTQELRRRGIDASTTLDNHEPNQRVMAVSVTLDPVRGGHVGYEIGLTVTEEVTVKFNCVTAYLPVYEYHIAGHDTPGEVDPSIEVYAEGLATVFTKAYQTTLK